MATPIDEVEAALIGACLLKPANIARAVAAGLDASWFESDKWSLMWSAFRGAWDRGEVDSVTAITAMAEAVRISKAPKERRTAEALTIQSLQSAIDLAPVGGIDATLRLLRNASIEKKAKDAVAKSFQAFPEQADSADVVIALRNRLDGVLTNLAETNKIPPRVVMDSILAEYEQAHKMRVAEDGPRDLKWTPGVKMPWPAMTRQMNGLRAGLHVIAARPSVGKTSYVINLMHYWCECGHKIAFCSLDMPRKEAVRRFIAEKARVSARKASFSPTKTDLSAMRQAADEVAAWPLSIVEMRDVDDLRTFCAIEKSAGRLDILVIDYLQLLHARTLGREDSVEYARVSYVSDTLKRLANTLEIPVVALAQLNRESTKQDAGGRMPGLADLRGSGSIEQDAFTVTILHRDEAVVQKWTKGENVDRVKRLIPGTTQNPHMRVDLSDLDPIWWVLCKAQNGPTGRLPFVVRKKYFTWMLGDWEASANVESVGYGSTKREVVDNSPKFERVHSDWRHDPLEEVLRLQLSLIQDEDAIGLDDNI